MKINIISKGNSFGFEIAGSNKVLFSSSRDHSLTSFVSKEYIHSWEACRDARRFVENHPIMHVAYDAASGYAEGDLNFTDTTSTRDLSEAEFIEHNYTQILETLSPKIKGSRDDKERDLLHKSLTSFIYEIGLLYEKNIEEGKKEESDTLEAVGENYKALLGREFGGQMADVDLQQLQQSLNPEEGGEGGEGGGLPGMASDKKRLVVAGGEVVEKYLDPKVAKEIVDNYACEACKAIQQFHNVTYDLDTGKQHYYINIYNLPEAGEKDLILVLRINRHLNIDNIIPSGELSSIFPLYSHMFYQRYWKPIVESIGHFFIEDFESLIVAQTNSLPDAPKGENKYNIDCWCADNKALDKVEISFKGKSPMAWMFDQPSRSSGLEKTSSSRYTEQEYAGAIVQCVDKNLSSLFGEMGEVVQVIPMDKHIELDVKFMNLADTDEMQVTKEESVEEIDIDGLVVRLTEKQVIIIDEKAIPNLKLGI